MYKLIEFIRNTYVVVLFVLFEAIAIGHYARSTHYTRARLLAKATRVVGTGHEALAGVRSYFRLERENRELLEYAAALQERLACYERRRMRRMPRAQIRFGRAGSRRPVRSSTTGGTALRRPPLSRIRSTNPKISSF